MGRILAATASAVFLALLSACAATDVPARWAQTPEPQRAVIFGTITAELGPPGPLSRYLIRFRNMETKEEAHLNINPGVNIGNDGDPELYEPKRSKGMLFDVTLPAGRYEFYDLWMVAVGLFGASTEYRPKQPFSIPFTVEPGTVNYLGEFRAYPAVGKGIFGPVTAGGYFVVRDREAREYGTLRQTPRVGTGPADPKGCSRPGDERLAPGAANTPAAVRRRRQLIASHSGRGDAEVDPPAQEATGAEAR